MDAASALDTIQEDNRTELSRLGSSKSLYADTGGEMEPDVVLAAVADMTHHAAEVLASWADEEDVEIFAEAADRERDHHQTSVDERGNHDPGETPAGVEAMQGVEGTPARLGALVGWTLVAERKASQCTGFFTGQAKPTTASAFRAFSDDYEESREKAVAVLDEVCDNESEWSSATDAATAVVQAAYDDYFETLESLGVNPKPVC